MSRTLQQIQFDYIEAAKQAGDASYRVELGKQDMARLHTRMLELNQEAAKVAQAEKEAQDESSTAQAAE